MAIPERWVGGDTPPNGECHQTAAAMLNADIEVLTAVKDTVESAPVKAVFESVTSILIFVRVRLLVLFQSLHPFIDDT